MNTKKPPQQLQLHHEPVLLSDVLQLLAPKKGETYLDLTAGYGGHARAVIDRVGKASLATLVDRDEMAIDALKPFKDAGAKLLHTDFVSATAMLRAAGRQFDMILADLGVSSPQFDIASRGFSIRMTGPLDMRMDRRQEQTAATLLNEASAEELADIIRTFGEEPKAKRIAKSIIEHRPLRTTTELRDVISQVVKKNSLDAAVRTFQALRIRINGELEQVRQLTTLLPDLLTPGGRVAIISFHSLEDRIIKRFLKEETEAGYEARLRSLTKQPIRGDISDVHNPRARSAKLRAAVKINI
ncbi:MAG TPA: 16S rRNA (cytosine(1402)-N(4))-methyltransferase RsmH [Candidatus Saccharimonadales bacterium]